MSNDAQAFIKKDMLDSHFHLLEMKKKGIDIKSHLRLCKDMQIFALFDMGITCDDLLERIPYYQENLPLYFAAGIYPSYVEEINETDKIDNEVKKLHQTIASAPIKVKAIGEIGIELFHPIGKLELQLYLLEKQINLANELELPVAIHNRNADSEILELLKKHPVKKGGVIHCFSSNKKNAYNFIDNGFKISFAGNITYKNNNELQDTIKKIPLSCILTETDSPYLTPQPLRKYPNSPLYIGHTYDIIAQLRNQKIEPLIQIIKENFTTLFLSS